jgi:hypothetical protein
MIRRVPGMSPSGDRAWRRRPGSGRAAAKRALPSGIRAVHAESGGAMERRACTPVCAPTASVPVATASRV